MLGLSIPGISKWYNCTSVQPLTKSKLSKLSKYNKEKEIKLQPN